MRDHSVNMNVFRRENEYAQNEYYVLMIVSPLKYHARFSQLTLNRLTRGFSQSNQSQRKKLRLK